MKILPVVSTLFGLYAAGAFVEGGGVRSAYSEFREGYIYLPPGSDRKDCELVPAPAESGVDVQFRDAARVVLFPLPAEED